MKRQTSFLTIKAKENPSSHFKSSIFFQWLTGCVLLTGVWGMVLQELQAEPLYWAVLLPAVLTLGGGLLLCWHQKWQAVTAVGFLAVLFAGCILLHESLFGSFAALAERLSYWLLLRTGRYLPPVETAGNLFPIFLIAAILSGILTAWVLRVKSPLMQVLLTAGMLLLWAFRLLQSGLFLGIYILGTMLVLAGTASGYHRSVTLSGSIALFLAAAFTGTLILSGFTPHTNAGQTLKRRFHSLCYEKADNPLPEGDLAQLGAYTPSDEAALAVTMEHWTPLYIRGLVTGVYTETGWKQISNETVAENAALLYALQADYFFPANQLSAAWQSLGKEAENAVEVHVFGACRAYSYVPYGAGAVEQGIWDPTDLSGEGTAAPKQTSYTTPLYPVPSSYLLQAELAQAGPSNYRRAEAVYRDWVYENYLQLPQDVRDVLSTHFSVKSTDITTTQAKREIVKFLTETMNYRENTVTVNGEKDFLSYVLEVSKEGYSVHFATLATLMLRYCGIPARYVEGYVVTPSQAEALADGETLTLTQYNTHAWTEYYLDGVGWLPFDATPGYTDILVYELPEEGTPTEDSEGIFQPPIKDDPTENPQKPPNTEQEVPNQSQQVYVREAVTMLLLIVLILILALILRTVLLRYRLRKRRERFYGQDYRLSTAAVLCYMLELLGLKDASAGSRHLSEAAAVLLNGNPAVTQLSALIDEVWYSGHPITENHRQQAFLWMREAMAVWKRKTPPLKRFYQRFIRCKII